MPYITKQFKFCAAHRYWNDSWSKEKNQAVFDKDILPKDSHICPSSKQGNKCGSCRACWSSKIKEVVYLAH